MSQKQILEQAIGELMAIRPELPYGISIKRDLKTDNLLVGNDDIGFCITLKAIQSGIHLSQYEPTLDRLIAVIEDPTTDWDLIRSMPNLIAQGNTTRFS